MYVCECVCVCVCVCVCIWLYTVLRSIIKKKRRWRGDCMASHKTLVWRVELKGREEMKKEMLKVDCWMLNDESWNLKVKFERLNYDRKERYGTEPYLLHWTGLDYTTLHYTALHLLVWTDIIYVNTWGTWHNMTWRDIIWLAFVYIILLYFILPYLFCVRYLNTTLS